MIRPMLAALAGSGLLASASPVAARSAPEACELHVWPSAELTFIRTLSTDGAGNRAGLIGDLIQEIDKANAERDDAKGLGALAASDTPKPLAVSRQIDILSAMPLPEMLGLPNHRLVVHDVPLESRTIRTVRTRYAQGDAPCYADLVLDDIVYSREAGRGRNLKTFFRFRDFADQTAPVRSFGTWVQTRLLIFSIDQPNFEPAALAEIAAALQSNATIFSDLLVKRKLSQSSNN